VAIDHLVFLSSESDGETVYLLGLQFPAFNSSVEYDPSLNLGLLVDQLSGYGVDTTLIA